MTDGELEATSVGASVPPLGPSNRALSKRKQRKRSQLSINVR